MSHSMRLPAAPMLRRLTMWLIALMVVVVGRAHGQGGRATLESLAIPTSAAVECASVQAQQEAGSMRRQSRTFILKGERFDERTVTVISDSTGTPLIMGDATVQAVDGHMSMTVLTILFMGDSVTGTRTSHRSVKSFSDMEMDAHGPITEMKFPLTAAERAAAMKLARWVGSQRCAGTAPRHKASDTIR